MLTYPVIAIHVDDTPMMPRRVEVAANIAKHGHSSVLGIAATGIMASMRRRTGTGDVAFVNPAYVEQQHLKAANALDHFDSLCRSFGVSHARKQLIDNEAALSLCTAVPYTDLVLLGQGAPQASCSERIDFPEYVILHSPCAVLVVPYDRQVFSIGDRILIAWDGSLPAGRAVRNAMPFLASAKEVCIAVINSQLEGQHAGTANGQHLRDYLAQHGVLANVVLRVTGDDAGSALLALAFDNASDLIIAGCVAHPHTSGGRLGGTTRVLLEKAHICLLMSG